MSLQAFLTRLYVDAQFRRDFFVDPIAAARMAGLSSEEARVVSCMDRGELELAAASFEAKRDRRTSAVGRHARA